MANSIQESINNAIDTIVSRRIDTLSLDKTVIGVIDSYVDLNRGIYKIKCDGGYFNARSQTENALYLTGMAVYVQIPQNDTTKEKLIISRANTIREDFKTDVTISAINNFSVIGTNLLQNTDNIIPTKGIGIRSYHSAINENENTISHRARMLFGEDYYYTLINESIFDIYKQDAAALMIEADFRTSLSEEQKQQSAGVYGIGLDLKFKNTDFDISDLQGDIFDYYAKDVKANITVAESNTNGEFYKEIEDANVKIYADNFYNDLKNSTNSVVELQADYGLINKYKIYISSIIETFKVSDQVANIGGNWLNVLNSYIALLNDLKILKIENRLPTKEELINYYEEWRNTKIASSEFNNVAFVLDSNNMTGNPYNYTEWSTQYAIFPIDMSTLTGINSILFYKNGFIIDEDKCVKDNTNSNPREDIFVKNIKIYALKPISAENGDYRLEISSPNGLVFDSLNEENTLTIIGKVTKAYYQNLTEQSGFYWFKKSKNVTNVNSNGYHQYGGIGWTYLSTKGNEKKLILTESENQAYENIYKCVSVSDETIVLAQEFYIYNQAVEAVLKIDSDLGVNFNFDSGNPTLTCLIQNEENPDTETYNYDWAILLNGQRTFLNAAPTIAANSTSIDEITSMLSYNNLINGIKFYDHDTELEEHFEKATRILYPISNIGLQNTATFECYVSKKNSNNYIDLGVASLTLTNSTNMAVNDYYIIIENGEQVFQYDEYGNSPIAQKLKDPIKIKPLICHLFNPVGIEISSGNYTLNWIVPILDSMIVPRDIENLIENPLTQLKQIDKSSQFVFDIAEFYNENLQNNQITCQVIFNGNIITKDTNLLFTKIGENGTNGTDIVARIVPNKISSILDQEPLTLYESIENRTTNILTLNDGTVSSTRNILLSTHLDAKLYLKNEEVVPDSVIWNVAGATKDIVNNTGSFIKIDDNKRLVWDQTYQPNKLSNYILRARLTYNEKDYYAFYPLCVIKYNGGLPGINRMSIDKQFLLKEIMYNADGRNPIYTHSQGVKINNLPTGSYIKWQARGGFNGDESAACFKLLTDLNDKRKDAVNEIETSINYIYILPDDDFNGSVCNNHVKAIVYDRNNNEIATIIVPIYMHLNTFGLASLNAWDGNTITIDEDGGYIMAPQIGAGEKDTNNRFSGILMGKTETRTGKSTSEKEIGLFGYTHGLQSIFLDAETGNATFGLPDGYILNSNNIPTQSEDNYTEGRIELRPGNISTIGGWRIGRRSLFYATAGIDKTINGINYAKGTVLPTLDPGNENKHEKDIGHQDSGILLAANNIYGISHTIGNNPYISLKGRPLKVWNGNGTKPDDADIDNSTGNSPLINGDSLELQLDPQQSSIFTIYRHYKKNDNEWARMPLVGINAEGRFYSNALQDEETSLNLNYVAAFGKQVSEQKYTGLYIGTTGRTFFKAFVDAIEDPANPKALRISGSKDGTEDGNSYERPITLHGKHIDLYASDGSRSIAETTNTKLTLSNSKFYAGVVGKAYISLPTANTVNDDNTITYNHGSLLAFNDLYIRTHSNSYNNNENLGNIYIQTRNANNDTSYSYLTLKRNGAASLQGWTDLNLLAQNGNINLKAQKNGVDSSWLILKKEDDVNLTGYKNVNITATNGDINLDAHDGNIIKLKTYDDDNLTIGTTSTVLKRRTTRTFGGYTDLYPRLFLNDGVNNDNYSYLDAINHLTLRAIGNTYITSKGTEVILTVGQNDLSKSSLTLNTNSNWNGGTAPTEEAANNNVADAFKFYNTHFGGFKFRPYIKPGYATNFKTSLQASQEYAGHSAALCGNSAGDGNTWGGLYFNWGWFPGRIFADTSHTGNADYVNTSIYANYRVVSNTGLRTTKNSSSITMLNHTISKSRSDFGYTSTCDITGDNLYTLLQQLLDEVAYTLNYAKWVYDNRNNGLGSAAWSSSGDFASSSHTHKTTDSHFRVVTDLSFANQSHTTASLGAQNTSGPQ